mgnify:CR=1 FL=1
MDFHGVLVAPKRMDKGSAKTYIKWNSSEKN